MSEDVLKRYEFHLQIAEEDVRDGDANPWERVVAALAAEARTLKARVKELETQCERCGLKLAHGAPPENDEMYSVPITTVDGSVHYIDYRTYGEVFI